tara:strand:+ start:5132 stop:5662 length:531 start_codon:yes stop_codon:yes gene_type:complete
MKNLLLAFMVVFSLPAALASKGPVHTKKIVDVESFVGKWYTISSLPQFFNRKCLLQTAEYKIVSEEEISLLNTCYKKRNKTSTISGQAKIVNFETNSELEVSFNSFFTRLFRVKADYNIIKIDDDYQYVMVGGRGRSDLWIMSKTLSMPRELYNEYVSYAKELGYPVKKLRFSKLK